jgi:hypothetical protein
MNSDDFKAFAPKPISMQPELCPITPRQLYVRLATAGTKQRKEGSGTQDGLHPGAKAAELTSWVLHMCLQQTL